MKRSFQVPRKRPAAEVDGCSAGGPAKLSGCYTKTQTSLSTASTVPSAHGRKPLSLVQPAAGLSAKPDLVSHKAEQGFQALYTECSNKRRNNKTWLGTFFQRCMCCHYSLECLAMILLHSSLRRQGPVMCRWLYPLPGHKCSVHSAAVQFGRQTCDKNITQDGDSN